MSITLTINSVKNILKKQLHAHLDLDKDTENMTDPVQGLHNIYTDKTFFTQSYRELRKLIKEKEINYNVDEFEPTGQWAYLHLNKFKLKWRENPEYTVHENKIFSILKQFRIRENATSDKLIVIPFRSDRVVMCIYMGSNPELEPSIIKKSFVRSKNIEKERLFMSDFKTDLLLQPGFPYQVKIANAELKLLHGLDFYRIIINHNGFYINRSTRETDDLVETRFSEETDCIINLSECLFWLEDTMTNQTLFISQTT